ncbi:MAG: PTS sugar transporter subunit IIA [bacterium]|nr:PTS sugar transporter subunit IIA [bacterium]
MTENTVALGIVKILTPQTIIINLKPDKKEAIIEKILEVAVKTHGLKNKDEILKALLEREKIGSTGVGEGIAIPHTPTKYVDEFIGVLAICNEGTDFQSVDGKPVYILFLLIYPPEPKGAHLKILAKLSMCLKDRYIQDMLLKSKTPEDVINAIKSFRA